MSPLDASRLLTLEGCLHGNKVNGKRPPRWFNFHRILVDRSKGPASEFLVQMDKIFIRFNFSYPDTHICFNFPTSPSAHSPTGPEDNIFRNLISRSAEAERGQDGVCARARMGCVPNGLVIPGSECQATWGIRPPLSIFYQEASASFQQ